MLKRRKKESIPERVNPGDREPEWCSPGSIEQQLDMCEEGSLRGDDILHHHGLLPLIESDGGPVALDQVLEDNFAVNMAEENREGDEMSGDEHSSGLQGDLEGK